MGNQSLRGYSREQTLTATARSYPIRALFFDLETEGQPPAETELWPILRSMEPGRPERRGTSAAASGGRVGKQTCWLTHCPISAWLRIPRFSTCL